MLIHNAVITGSLTLNGIDIGDITGSEASVAALNSFSASILSYTASNNTNISALQSATASLQTFSSSILTYTASNNTNINALQTFSSSILTYTASNDTTNNTQNSRLSSLEVTSGSLINASASFSTRVANTETTSSNLTIASASFSTRVANNEATGSSLVAASASFSTRVANTEATSSNLVAASASFSSSISSLQAVTGSYATTGSNTFVGANYFSNASNAISFTSTSSLYSDGGMRITKDMYVSGTAYFNNVTVYGTQSISYISSSQLNIGTNIISVNTDTPTIRFGGLSVYDSGSTGLTGSILWDSEANHWVYNNPSGSTYSGGMLISGPRASSLGSEQGTTCNAIMKGQGGDHITSSGIFDYGICTNFYNNALFVSSSGNIGVNTVTPGERLEVYGGHIKVANNSNTAYIGFGASNGTTGFTSGLGVTAIAHQYEIYDNLCGVTRVKIDGTGTSTFTNSVCVGGGLVAQAASTFCNTVGLFGAAPQLYIGATNGASDYTILKWCTTDKSLNIHNQSTGGNPQLVIACNGNVGVKTIATPNYDFEVRGNIGALSSTSAGLITTSTLCAAGALTGFVRFDGLHSPSSTIYTGPSISACKDDANYTTSLLVKTTDGSGINNTNLRITGAGVACFAGTVCAAQLISSGNITSGDSSTIKSTSGFLLVQGTTNLILDGATGTVNIRTNSVDKLLISNGGIACFSGTVCVPTIIVNNCINIGTTTSLGSRLSIESCNDQAGITMYNSYDCNKWSLRTGTTGINNKGFGIVDDICNVTRIQINGAGDVGIGTLSPQNYSGYVSLTIGDNNLNKRGLLKFRSCFNSGSGAEIYQSTAGVLSFSLTGADVNMSINCSGNVGIGTGSPSDRLTVTDASTYTFNVGAASGGAGAVLYTLGSAALTFATCGSSNERMRITSAGCVGIGTTSPGRQLELSTNPGINIVTGTGYPGGSLRLSNLGEYESGYGTGGGNPDFLGTIEFYSGDTSTGVGVRTAIKSTVDAYYNLNALAFYTAPGNTAGILERMRIEPNGNVGIGLTTPQYALSIQRTGNVALHFSTNGCYTGECIDITGGGQCTVTDGNSAFRIRSVVTAPLGRATGNLGFWVNCGDKLVERMHIGCTGNVGIGTSTPVSTCLNGAITIVKSHNGDTPPSTTGQCYYCNQSGLYVFGRNSGITLVSSNNEEGRLFFSNQSSEWHAIIGATTLNTSAGGTMYFRTGASTCNRFTIDNTGIACFACQVCAPTFLGSTATLATAGTACTVSGVLTLATLQTGGASVCAGAAIVFEGNAGATVARIYSRGNMNFNNGSDLVFQTQVSAGGTPQCTMVINGNSQSVGIGVFNPGGKLNIYSSDAANNVQLRINQADRQYWDFITTQNESLTLKPQKSTSTEFPSFVIQNASGCTQFNINTFTGIACFACQVCALNGFYTGDNAYLLKSSLRLRSSDNANYLDIQSTSTCNIISSNYGTVDTPIILGTYTGYQCNQLFLATNCRVGVLTNDPKGLFEVGMTCAKTTYGGFLVNTLSVADSDWFCFFCPPGNWAGLMTMHWVSPSDYNRSGAAQIRWSYQACAVQLGPTTSIFNDSQNATATFRYCNCWMQACITGVGNGYNVQFTILGSRGS